MTPVETKAWLKAKIFFYVVLIFAGCAGVFVMFTDQATVDDSSTMSRLPNASIENGPLHEISEKIKDYDLREKCKNLDLISPFDFNNTDCKIFHSSAFPPARTDDLAPSVEEGSKGKTADELFIGKERLDFVKNLAESLEGSRNEFNIHELNELFHATQECNDLSSRSSMNINGACEIIARKANVLENYVSNLAEAGDVNSQYEYGALLLAKASSSSIKDISSAQRASMHSLGVYYLQKSAPFIVGSANYLSTQTDNGIR